MKKLAGIFVLLMLLSFSPAATALADHGQPVGQCAPPFHLHHIGDHHEGGHRHIGLDADLNGDGYICVYHVSDETHLHVDNNVGRGRKS